MPDLIPSELEFWLADQRINARGVAIDTKAVSDCIAVIEEAYKRYNGELAYITNGEVKSASEIARLIKWLGSHGIHVETLDDDNVTKILEWEHLTPDPRRALEIRQLIGSSSVKKLYAMTYTATSKERIHGLFIYHSARTGRAAGAGVQPQNLPNSGDSVSLCTCGKYSSINLDLCPWCGSKCPQHKDWNTKAVQDALEVIATRNLDCVEYFFGNAISTVSGCLRGMFIPASGHDFICSDYASIEAIVLAMLACEQWQLEVFRTHGKIYEMSASKLSGIPFEEFDTY